VSEIEIDWKKTRKRLKRDQIEVGKKNKSG